MSTQTNITAMSPDTAYALLSMFHGAVTALCQAQSTEELLAQRTVVATMLGQVESAIAALKPHTLVVPFSERAVLPENAPDILRGSSENSFDKLEDIVVKLAREAEQQGKCPAVTVLYRAFYQNQTMPEVPVTGDMEHTRGKLLRLAQYMVHEFAPAYLTSIKFPKIATQLEDVPTIRERDDLPEAMRALDQLRTAVARQYDYGYPHPDSTTVLTDICPLLRKMSSVLAELDGFNLKPGMVLARLVWAFRVGNQIHSKEAIDRALLGT